MKEPNIVKQVCKAIEKSVVNLKSVTDKNALFTIDAAIKELIETRSTIDFIRKEQTTDIDWNKVAKAMR